MKRAILTVALCAVGLALAACGGKDVDKPAGNDPPAAQTALASYDDAAEDTPEGADLPVDLDLTALSGTVVYSQVYDMMMEPEAYMGQRVRMKGNLSYYRDSETNQEYFAAVIPDATACCTQGIEFVWKGDHVYPRDYPPLDSEITVVGVFDTYMENDYTFIRLDDAEMTWQG